MQEGTLAKVWSGGESTAALVQESREHLDKNEAARREEELKKRKERAAQKPEGQGMKKMKITVCA